MGETSHCDITVTLGSGQGAGSSLWSQVNFPGMAEGNTARARSEHFRGMGLQASWSEPVLHHLPGQHCEQWTGQHLGTSRGEDLSLVAESCKVVVTCAESYDSCFLSFSASFIVLKTHLLPL